MTVNVEWDFMVSQRETHFPYNLADKNLLAFLNLLEGNPGGQGEPPPSVRCPTLGCAVKPRCSTADACRDDPPQDRHCHGTLLAPNRFRKASRLLMKTSTPRMREGKNTFSA